MPVTWTAEKYQKLLSAVIAAHPEFKFNYREIAIYFGESTTYDAIEGCFRPLKKKATQLRDEIDKGVRPKAPAGPSHRKKAKRSRGESEMSERLGTEEPLKRSRTTASASATPRLISASPVKARKPSPEIVVIDDDDGDDEDELEEETSPIKLKPKPAPTPQQRYDVKTPVTTPKKQFSKPAAPILPASRPTTSTPSFSSSFSSTSTSTSSSQLGFGGTPMLHKQRYKRQDTPSDDSDGPLYG